MNYMTNVTILLPVRKIYCDYRVNLQDNPNGTTTGEWSVIDFMPTPTREGYGKFNPFLNSSGDAALDKGMYPGYHLFLLRPGYLKSPVMMLFNGAYAHIRMDVKDNMFHPGKASWAKEAELVPPTEEAIAIFWE